MEKLAETTYPINRLLQARWSPRAFAPQPVEDEKLMSLFEAARWAPSANNGQPWAYIVTRRDEGYFSTLASTLKGFNSGWAPSAPVLVLTLARAYREGEALSHYSYYDLGQSVAHLIVQASAVGLVVRQMGGFDGEKARELFDLPADVEPMTVLAIGYPGSPDDLPEALRERELAPRSRKPLDQVAFMDNLGNPLERSLLEEA